MEQFYCQLTLELIIVEENPIVTSKRSLRSFIDSVGVNEVYLEEGIKIYLISPKFPHNWLESNLRVHSSSRKSIVTVLKLTRRSSSFASACITSILVIAAKSTFSGVRRIRCRNSPKRVSHLYKRTKA